MKHARASALIFIELSNLYSKALVEIAELDGDCEQQQFKLTRFQASQVARKALADAKVLAFTGLDELDESAAVGHN